MPIRALSSLALLLAFSIACSRGSATGPSGATPPSSGNNVRGSHNAGANCQQCHASFTVAGTVYKPDGTTPNPGVVIRLFSSAAGSGTAVATLTADGSGNFYSSAAVSFGSGLTASATSPGGSARTKTAAITSGACNRCHVAGSRILAD